ncbi:hypothetical protein [Rubellicoccus peritrichatus]|uniref:Uncharacterized protein n=1 Tax=Rubellicoccus peritrichatus TaxID=3080537 RepID=A0AAQ3L9Z1_9BACT|nr:hypothetical protein [Puniceicoccus sp. CR14]WOO41826.1 hypothetical protein RZN69_01910 [Puniceicoccus sp. CR14]
MDLDLRWPLILFTNLLLLWLLRMVNHSLGPYGITIFLPALFIFLPALAFRLRWGLLLVATTALLQSAYQPGQFGFEVLLYTIVLTVLFANRVALRRASSWQQLWVLFLINTSIWAATTIIQGADWLGYGHYWYRSLSDLLISTLLLFPVGAWFLRSQNSLLVIVGLNPQGRNDD